MKILTYGTFDLFHIGHLNILRRAKALGGHLTVAISTDEFNLESKNKVCAQPYYERAEIVHAIKYVDEVIAETSWDQKIKDVVDNNIDVFVIGDDWEGEFDFLKEYCEVVYLPRTEGVSTTERKQDIIKKFK
ncbi:MAG: glycerol-3-phosphate cytidylyltransferase [Verrucomicrobiales bacterium]|jgi:glycerol-3-phosphate cytidylyltransferase|uniref:glycerol-3-phosphate cytidylyltransferase n=1 Tax=Vibrio chagasii TaxID=170679 RepID=UPI000C43067C|nr:glycerol-3-phosphate cytidylyltransferase [Verrucomicrobiales bacterium]CAH7138949.1 Glycerol-3-phosphate cytidylyltransferase [Vibrio chagasii]|tara:strand:+ start:9997 stop:10392 length:396 start_codon:yes stop_codon:yes gene_type:complete